MLDESPLLALATEGIMTEGNTAEVPSVATRFKKSRRSLESRESRANSVVVSFGAEVYRGAVMKHDAS